MDTQVTITAGPSEMQLMMSLMRPCQGPYGIDINKATSVHFTTDLKDPKVSGFSASINGMSREYVFDNCWNINGHIFDCPNIHYFSGYYDSKTRRGSLKLTS